MGAVHVALQLQTTGARPGSDNIIEIGAVKFGPNGYIDTYSTLVSPHHQVPYQPRLLSGITDDELRAAPRLSEIAADLERFVAATVLTGEHLDLSLRFLEEKGITLPNQRLDLLELADIVLPGLTDRSLDGITQYLGLATPVPHRALARAETVMQVFLAIRTRTLRLPQAALAEIHRLALGSQWDLRLFIEDLLQDQPGDSANSGFTVSALMGRTGGVKHPASLTANATKLPVLPEEAKHLLARAAEQPERFPGFERRTEQLTMTGAIAKTLSEGGQIIVEAGTGTGKSLAYLVPAALYALRNNARVVISTNTINLQEQLTGKDIPLLQRLLVSGLEPACDAELRAVTLKGRRNYLCLRRWSNLLHAPTLGDTEIRFLTRLLAWLPQTKTGDRAEINLNPTEETLWERVSAENETCLGSGCPFVRDGSCFLLQARKRAEAAHLVIVNHALLLSDIAAGGHVLPGYDYLIVDEAHNLEEEATRQFGFSVSENELNDYLNRIHNPGRGLDSGLATSLRNAVRRTQALSGPAAAVASLAAVFAERVDRARAQVPPLFRLLEAFMRRHAEEHGEYDRRLLLTKGVRAQPEWSEIEQSWENLRLNLSELRRKLDETQAFLQDCSDMDLLDPESLLAEASDLSLTTHQLLTGLADIIDRDDPERIAWLSAHHISGSVSLASAPLDVSGILRDRLWERKEAVVLTSATLSTEGRFDYVRARLGLEDAEELLLGSPFDYARSTLLLLPRNIPDPGHPAHQSTLAAAVRDLCRASQGRALVLLTSYNALRTLYQAIKRPLEAEGVLVLGQGLDGTPKLLLETLREKPRTVVLGTASFWEGVDVVGEALSLLIMAKLPFAVPTDPVFAARAALYEDAFKDYALPQAILRFKQGFGRLIRHKSDRGVMVLLDPRVRSRNYGTAFLRSLPPCTVREGPLPQLVTAVQRWLEDAGTG